MAVQTNTQNTLKDLVRGGKTSVKQDQTLLQDAGRSGDLVWGTLMAKVAASQKWIAFVNPASTDGTAIPQGVYIGADIAEADIKAGDIENIEILDGANCDIDKNLLTIENSKTLATLITVGTTDIRTVEDRLKGTFNFSDTIDSTDFA